MSHYFTTITELNSSAYVSMKVYNGLDIIKIKNNVMIPNKDKK